MEERKFHLFSLFRELLSDEKRRPLAIRYAFPAITALLTTVIACLPMIVFRSVGGDSDAHSLFYWQHVNFFGTGARWGALDFLIHASSGDQYLGLYRAVTVLYLLCAVLFFVGFVLSMLLSISAFYLLFTEEESTKSKQVGRLFRVVFGNRAMLLIPSGMLLIPFTFHHFLSYFYTVFQSFESTTRFRPIDPLILTILLFVSHVLIALWVKPKEKHAEYVIFRRFDAHLEERRRKIDDERAWESEVQADVERKPISLKGNENESDPILNPTDVKIPEASDSNPASDEESLYGKTIFLSGDARSEDSDTYVLEKEKAEPLADAQNEQTAQEMRKSVQALFADENQTSQKE